MARDGARASGRSGGAADITLVNLNMLYMRYGEEIERELHVPLGCLYLTRALEQAGYTVDLRDYQTVASDDPFDMQVFLDFLSDPAPVIGLSCMANLLPFTVLAIRALRERYPDRRVLLGGVGAREILQYACGYARTWRRAGWPGDCSGMMVSPMPADLETQVNHDPTPPRPRAPMVCQPVRPSSRSDT